MTSPKSKDWKFVYKNSRFTL